MKNKLLFILVMFAGLGGKGAMADYTLGIQPILPQAETVHAWQPLADYLSEVLGSPVRIVTQPDFLHYGLRFDDPKVYDFTLDAAHLAAWRVKHAGAQILARIEGQVSYSLVVRSSADIVEPEELIAKPVATLSAPAMGALLLADRFSNPVRQPRIIESSSSRDSMRALRNSEVEAAMVPTPLLAGAGDFVPIYQTQLFPHMAFSSSRQIPEAVRSRVKRALVTAKFTRSGKAMLEAVNISGFEAADMADYAPLATMLRGVWHREHDRPGIGQRLRQGVAAARRSTRSAKAEVH